jgi:hypothetical protein
MRQEQTDMSQYPVDRPPDSDRVENLSSHRPEIREQTNHAVMEIGPEANDRLLTVLEEEVRKYRKQRAATRAKYLQFVVSLLAVFTFWMVQGLRSGQAGQGNVFLWLSIYSIFIISACVGVRVVSRTYYNAARGLAELEDIRAIGFLVEMLESKDAAERRVTTGALCKLLPKLRASDSHLLNASQRKILDRALKKAAFGNDAAFALMILKAYAQIGDETALETVESIANVPAENRKVLSLVVEEARNCLPALKERVEHTRASQTLLRPSSAADALSSAAETLLRPATNTGDTVLKMPTYNAPHAHRRSLTQALVFPT